MMHFSPVSDLLPYFRKTFRLCGKFSKFYLIFPFSSAKISDDLFYFEFPPYFPYFSTFPPVSRKLLFPPYFEKFPHCFPKIHLLFTYFMCISFPPYFDHDAFMHHPMHVLDAPGFEHLSLKGVPFNSDISDDFFIKGLCAACTIINTCV